MNATAQRNGFHPATAAPPKLLTVKQVATRLGFTPRTVWRWVGAGVFPKPVRFGVSVRWPGDVIERIAREGLPPPAA